MRAGTLTDHLSFEEKKTIQTGSGATKVEYVSVLKTRASKKKLSAVINQDGINASQQFLGNMLVFQVRYNPLIKEDMRVFYSGNKYSIQLLDKQADNTYLITLVKENNK